MKSNKKIITERLILEPFSEKYLSEEYVSWLNNPELMKFSENRHRTHTLESCREYMESFNNSSNFFWAIILRNSQKHIGNINVYIDTYNSTADIGLLIGDSNAHRKGFGYEVWSAVIDFLIAEQNIRKITAGTMALNQGMLKIMKNSGMMEDGIRKGQFILDREAVDGIYMAIFNKEYKI